MKKQIKLMLGDNIESLKKIPDNSVDSIVTDPPYGLGKEQDMNIVLKDWIEKGYSEIKGNGFMGKEWDAYVPQPLFWKEIFRVLKPGGHVLSFFGTSLCLFLLRHESLSALTSKRHVWSGSCRRKALNFF